MTPLKETLEVGESPVSQGTNPPKTDSGHLRSDAVSLDVPVKVHGSRVKEVVRGVTPHTEPFEEQTATMIVFPLGGVLRMATPVSVGQAIVLTNLKSRQDAICRVLKVRMNPNMQAYVEIEFTHPQPGYWGVYFASDGPELAKRALAHAPAPPPIAIPSAAPSAPPPTPAPSSAPTDEPPEPAAGAIVAGDPFIDGGTVLVEEPKKAERPSTLRPPVAAPAPAPAPVLLTELRGDSLAAATKPALELEEESDAPPETAERSQEDEQPTFGRFAATTKLDRPRPAPKEILSAGLENGTLGASEHSAEAREGKSWLLIVAVSVVLIAAVAAGAFYFYVRPATQPVIVSVPAPPPLPAEANASIGSDSSATLEANHTPPASATSARKIEAVSPPPKAQPPETAASKPAKASRSAQNETGSGEKQEKEKSNAAVPDMFGALNAHPVSSLHGGAAQGDAAPEISASGTSADDASSLPALAGASAASVNLAKPIPEGPVPVGGNVLPPHLISSVTPEYPEIARNANTQGSVIVRILIDKTGRVAQAKAISGSILLQPAAVDALRKWKYQPATLNGQPVSTEILVTVQFHR
jgi:TonB family protein